MLQKLENILGFVVKGAKLLAYGSAALFVLWILGVWFAGIDRLLTQR